MLGKLLKYEIKAMGRVMLPLYAVMVFAACLFAFNLRLNMSGVAKFIVDRFAIVTGFLFGAAVLAVFVVMVIIVIQRFYKNLLGTEGYLMFTLPARTHEHILSKAISSFLWILIGGAAGFAAGFAMVGITSNIPAFIRQVQEIWNELVPHHAAGPFIWFIILLLAGIFESLIKVYAAIAVGHQFGSHRLAGSILAYIGFGIIEMAVSFIANKLHLLPRNLFALNAGGLESSVRGIQAGLLVVLLQMVIYGLLCWYLLDRKLNLE